MLQCPHCGYSLDGLATLKCPECGETVSLGAAQRHLRARSDRAAWRAAYAVPGLLLVAGLGIALALVAGATNGWSIGSFLIVFAIELVAAGAIYVACASAWIGLAVSLQLSMLQLGAVLAVEKAVYWGISALWSYRPIHWSWYILIWLVIIALMAKIMDLDWNDAAIVCTLIAVTSLFMPALVSALGWI